MAVTHPSNRGHSNHMGMVGTDVVKNAQTVIQLPLFFMP